jgi:MFS family permease
LLRGIVRGVPKPPLLTRAFLLLVSGQFLQALGFSSMLLLPLYLEELGASREQIGFFHMTLAAIGGLVSRPLVAYALDKLGRKPTLLAGTAALTAGTALLYLVRDLGPLLYAARILYGIGGGALFSAYFTAASDVIPPSRRTEGLALFGVFGLLPIALNPLVSELGLEPSDLPRYFLFLSGVIAASVILILLVPETRGQKDPDESDDDARLGPLAALFAPRLWPVWLATVVFSSLVAAFMSFVTVAARASGLENPALTWLPYAFGAVGVRIFGARLPDAIGPANLVVPSLGSYALGMLVAASGEHFLLAGLLAGLGHGYCFPVLTGQVVTRTPAAWRGSSLTLFTTIWAACELFLTPGLGWIADHHGDAVMFCGVALAACGLLAVWAVLEHSLGSRGRRRP